MSDYSLIPTKHLMQTRAGLKRLLKGGKFGKTGLAIASTNLTDAKREEIKGKIEKINAELARRKKNA